MSPARRRLRPGTVEGAYITIGKRRMINLCSNDYLGMPPTPVPDSQMQSSSRLLSGSDPAHSDLERRLARHRSSQKALLFPTGYAANLGAIAALAGNGDTVLSDELNHASIIDACRLSGARVRVYSHNDAGSAARAARGARGRIFVVTEGVFSMDGDSAPLAELAEESEKAGATLVLDDAHGDFAVGRGGRGSASLQKVSKRVGVHTGSLSKALGSFGGYAAMGAEAARTCVDSSRAFIYTTALPSSLALHALGRMGSDRGPYQARLADNSRYMARELGGLAGSSSHIIPVVVGGEREAARMSAMLERQGVFAPPIRHPTVPRGRARIRISVTAWLSREQVGECADAVRRAARRAGLL